jgi:dihydrofolate reductase
MSVRIIVAVDRDSGFGKDGKIPWHYPEDFKHFKETTSKQICIMGRKTYEDMAAMMKKAKRKIKKNILPNRTCYVLSSADDATFKGATQVGSLREVMDLHPEEANPRNPDAHIFILGGEKLYVESLAWATHVHMTVIDNTYECDRFFPIEALDTFGIVEGNKIKAAKDDTELYMVTYGRK